MSTPSSVSNGTIFEEYEVFYLGMDTLQSATTFLVYSYLLLLGQEIEHIWRDPTRPASLLYAFIRYPGLLSQLLSTGLNSYTPHCTAAYRLGIWSEVIALVAVYVFQIMRTYAVCGRRIWLATLLVALAAPTAVLQAIKASEVTCLDSAPLSWKLEDACLIFDLAFESIVLIANVWATLSHVVAVRRLNMRHADLATMILRNGLIYYAIFVLIEGSILVTENLPTTNVVTKVNVAMSQFANAIRWSLACQFILELRNRSVGGSNATSDVSGSTPTMTTFQAAVEVIRDTVDRDLGEHREYPLQLHNRRVDESYSIASKVEPDSATEVWDDPAIERLDADALELKVRV